MNVSMLSNHVFQLFFWLQLIYTKKAWITTLSAKRLQLGDFVPQTPYYFFYFSAKLNNFQKSNIQYRFVHECGQLNMFSNHACCCLFQMCAPNMHQNEWFQVRFLKIFWGGAHRAPSPDPSPVFLWASPSVWASPSILRRFSILRIEFSILRLGLRSRFSGASRPRFGLRPQLSIGKLGLAPQINFWIRHCTLVHVIRSRQICNPGFLMLR